MRLQLARRFLCDHHIKLLWVIVAALLIGNINGFVAGYTSHDALQRALGGKRDTPAVIRAHAITVTPRPVGGGGPVDLSYLFGPVGYQVQDGQQNACGSYSLTALLYALRIQRGERPATYFSPWFHRYNTVGLTDGYTTMDQNITAAYTDGMVYHYRQERPGVPTADEVSHADAKSAYYSIFSTGGAGTFDRIAYEVETGHPVWWLHAVYDGEWYLAGGNPYTDNGGAYHGSHFEVVVGVYGNYLKVRGSWGTAYGQGGYYYVSRDGVDRTTEEAAVVSIGPRVVWPAPAAPAPNAPPRPAPTARPMARPTVAPKPTAPALPPAAPTATSGGTTTPVYRVLADHALRVAPRLNAPHGRVVRRGWALRGTGRRVGSMVQGRTLDGKSTGWVALAWVRREK